MSEAQYKNQKFQNTLRAGALFISMLALMLGLGYTLFGFTGMLWAGAFGLITLGMSTRVSSQMIMRFQGGRPLHPQQAPQLSRLLQQLAQRAGLPATPKLYYVPNNSLNAFATGSKKDPAIAITHGLLSTMDLRGLSGILAHEISHIRNNDLQLKSMVNLFSRYTRFFSLFGQILLFINLPLFFMGEATVSWMAIALLLLAPTLVTLMVQAFSRSREYDADLEAARLTGDPNALADALETLDYYNKGGWLARFQSPRGIKVPTILSSHPEIKDRVKRLRELAPRFVPRFDWASWQPTRWRMI
jgi:heat shock protein HtpX